MALFLYSEHSEGRRDTMKTEESQSCRQQGPSAIPFGETADISQTCVDLFWAYGPVGFLSFSQDYNKL